MADNERVGHGTAGPHLVVLSLTRRRAQGRATVRAKGAEFPLIVAFQSLGPRAAIRRACPTSTAESSLAAASGSLRSSVTNVARDSTEKRVRNPAKMRRRKSACSAAFANAGITCQAET